MKKIKLIIVFVLLAKCANAGVMDSGINCFRLSVDIIKPLEMYYGFNHAKDAGIPVQYFFAKHFGIALAGGYGNYQNDNPNIGNLHDFTSSGYYVKPGILICSKGKSAIVELNYAFCSFSETGKYVVSGPYWGDLIVPYSAKLKSVYFDANYTQSVYTTALFDFKIGFGFGVSNILFGQRLYGHDPIYLPGFGTNAPDHARFLGTINFKIPQKQ